MQTKSLLYGLIGFFLGGLLVAVAVTTFEKPTEKTASTNTPMSAMTMTDMAASLQGKTGDDFDKAFVAEMIVHHQGAVRMAELASVHAKHDEVKKLSEAIIRTQKQEISDMRQWQMNWGYMSGANMKMERPMH